MLKHVWLRDFFFSQRKFIFKNSFDTGIEFLKLKQTSWQNLENHVKQENSGCLELFNGKMNDISLFSKYWFFIQYGILNKIII